jgi:hypothetical protein
MLRRASALRPAGRFVRVWLTSLAALGVFVPGFTAANDFCPDIYEQGKFDLNINPAFMTIDEYTNANGQKYDALVFSSFFNSIKNAEGTSTVDWFDRDQVAIIRGIGYRSQAWWNKNTMVETVTDLDIATPQLPNGPGQQVWPNEVDKVPDGILPFEAIVSPQGFHPTPPPGRLSIINMDDPNKQEYLVHQSLQTAGVQCRVKGDPLYNPLTEPRFYHKVVWWDMDGDGLKDAVTVRSGFKVSGTICFFPASEAVWFKNPGASIDPNVEWDEFVIAGYPSEQYAADISLDIADLEGDGIPEVVAGNFFTADAVTLYGAPVGDNWTDVDPDTNPARSTQISTTNGPTFAVSFADLNRDGKLDVLATNHQGDDCFGPTAEPIPGRVFALEQPASGDLFNDPWVQHTLKDDIRPNPSYPEPSSGPGRLAPGIALPFWPTPYDEWANKPWILVGGDEASKVWVLKPESQDATNWNYGSAVIFDINDAQFYGPNTSQSFSAPAPATGVSISTIGFPAWRYDRDWAWGSYAEIYIPVFEGRDIWRISFRPGPASKKLVCPADVQIACPAP